MTFKRPNEAIEWWFGYLQDGGVPLENRDKVQEEYEYFEQVQTSRKKWLPHDTLCAYIDIGKALERLSDHDQAIVTSYLLEVVGVINQEKMRTPYFRWKHRKMWGAVARRFWRTLPKEYKRGHR